MKCTNKGKCCKELIDGMFELETINDEKIILTVDGGKCEHLTEEGLCSIYENRPKACEDYFCQYCQYS